MIITDKKCQLSYLIFSFLNDSRLLAPKYSEYFTGSAPPTLYSWSNSQIGCSAPLYSRSSSLIRSAYFSLYINFCFGFNKTLTNLTLLRQHHLQYTVNNKCTSLAYIIFINYESKSFIEYISVDSATFQFIYFSVFSWNKNFFFLEVHSKKTLYRHLMIE